MDSQRQTSTRSGNEVLQSSKIVLRRACACGQHTLKGEECDDCKKLKSNLQRQASQNGGASNLPSTVYDVLRSSGQSLDRSTRAFMEPCFGQDFSQVRIHTDGQAAASARAVNALAYTMGRDVVFDSGQYQPGTKAGNRLLAHELTHVIQQGRRGSQSVQQLQIGPADDPFEREAEAVANSIVRRGRPEPVLNSGLLIQRQTASAETESPKKAPSESASVGSGICSTYGDQAALEKNQGFCKDTEGTGKLHPGYTCFREVHTGSGCPPGKHVCFKKGSCASSESHVDSTAPSLKRRGDGFCDISYLGLCSILHGIRDVVPWKKVGIGAGILGAYGAAMGAVLGGGAGALIGAGVGVAAGGVLGGISQGD